MRRGLQIRKQYKGLSIEHHNLPGMAIERHSHSEHHLIIPLQGEATIVLEHDQWTCSPGKMIYVPPHTVHSFHSATGVGERLVCLISERVLELEKPHLRTQVLPASQLGKELLVNLLLKPDAPSAPALIQAFFATITEVIREPRLDLIFDLDILESKVQRTEMKKAVAILRSEFTTPISTTDLAKRSGSSPRNLTRMFQAEINMTPKQLISILRMEQAKELLKTGNVAVTNVAFEVGYQSLSHFISTFRSYTGKLPSDYK